ncbi:hypothetical protein MPTK1_6g09760 [Marchantia polymorpha subsp. ruderalis]|uniref:Uncharacterized protein n=2 Tax=Marchantia polymorpha TaxID=3197 RepID=A0AAF6BQC0_MARPO|nr:hypothetical protein MARPO_0016s0020 [Marchantia polymorpha]BBN14204.1 hypothetical protein Mp_6g09760 [Marchantia polymorpha subsp. ruderalis]|eukprot:PTQ44939.1 hypothetical protein MARPO_0016s0020 [Marchantia polymorpha]
MCRKSTRLELTRSHSSWKASQFSFCAFLFQWDSLSLFDSGSLGKALESSVCVCSRW